MIEKKNGASVRPYHRGMPDRSFNDASGEWAAHQRARKVALGLAAATAVALLVLAVAALRTPLPPHTAHETLTMQWTPDGRFLVHEGDAPPPDAYAAGLRNEYGLDGLVLRDAETGEVADRFGYSARLMPEVEDLYINTPFPTASGPVLMSGDARLYPRMADAIGYQANASSYPTVEAVFVAPAIDRLSEIELVPALAWSDLINLQRDSYCSVSLDVGLEVAVAQIDDNSDDIETYRTIFLTHDGREIASTRRDVYFTFAVSPSGRRVLREHGTLDRYDLLSLETDADGQPTLRIRTVPADMGGELTASGATPYVEYLFWSDDCLLVLADDTPEGLFQFSAIDLTDPTSEPVPIGTPRYRTDSLQPWNAVAHAESGLIAVAATEERSLLADEFVTDTERLLLLQIDGDPLSGTATCEIVADRRVGSSRRIFAFSPDPNGLTPTWIDFSPDGRRLLVDDESRQLVWEIAIDDLLE